MQLSTAELKTLETLSDKERAESLSRSHLEKFLRLDLIEPCSEGICLTGVGKKILVRTK